MNENARGLSYLIMKKEKCQDLKYYSVSCIRGYTFSFYDSTNAYTTRHKNGRYVDHNVATMTATPNGCSSSIATKECSPYEKGAHGMCESTGGSIVARVDRVQKSKQTSNCPLKIGIVGKQTDMIGLTQDYVCLHLTSVGGPLTEYFLEYSSHVLLLFFR